MWRSLSLGLAGVLAVLTPALAQPADDKAAILVVEQGVAAAADADVLMSYYAPGETTVLFDSVLPGAFHGAAAIRQDFANQFAAVKSVKVDIKSMSIGVSGPLGYAFSIQHAVMVNKDGARQEVTFRQTDILQRDSQGQWKIIHQHLSYPVDPATAKAAFNAPP